VKRDLPEINFQRQAIRSGESVRHAPHARSREAPARPAVADLHLVAVLWRTATAADRARVREITGAQTAETARDRATRLQAHLFRRGRGRHGRGARCCNRGGECRRWRTGRGWWRAPVQGGGNDSEYLINRDLPVRIQVARTLLGDNPGHTDQQAHHDGQPCQSAHGVPPWATPPTRNKAPTGRSCPSVTGS
jgi:hypothetical protein